MHFVLWFNIHFVLHAPWVTYRQPSVVKIMNDAAIRSKPQKGLAEVYKSASPAYRAFKFGQSLLSSLFPFFDNTMSLKMTQFPGIAELLRQESGIFWKLAAFVLLIYLLLPKPTYKTDVKVPTVKFGSSYFPEVLSRLLFNSRARTVIYGGYTKVSSIPAYCATVCWHTGSTKCRHTRFWNRTETWLFSRPNTPRSYDICHRRLSMLWKLLSR